MSASKGLDLEDIFKTPPAATPIAAAGEGKDAAHTNGKAASKAKPKRGKKATGKDKKKRKRQESDSDEAEESEEADEAEDEEPAEDDDEAADEEMEVRTCIVLQVPYTVGAGRRRAQKGQKEGQDGRQKVAGKRQGQRQLGRHFAKHQGGHTHGGVLLFILFLFQRGGGSDCPTQWAGAGGPTGPGSARREWSSCCPTQWAASQEGRQGRQAQTRRHVSLV
jgi:hypothetical protein